MEMHIQQILEISRRHLFDQGNFGSSGSCNQEFMALLESGAHLDTRTIPVE